jgi:DNA-binding NarL/FixJ family response regulator
LAFPATQDNDVLDYAAVELFLLHARRLHPHYQPDERDVAGIVKVCRLVDGMPLGILLAAALSGAISPAQIAAELGRDIGFLLSDMQDIPARQRNLRAIFLHTWERLSAAERDVFMRLSVFRGGATPEAAQQVTGATVSVLAGLIDNALLWRLPSGRYAVHELLRQFAAEQLAAAAGDAKSDAQRQHSLYYFGLLEKQEQLLQGQQQRAAVNTIRADYENVSAAWRWAVQAGEFSLLAPAIHPFYLWCEVQGSYREGVLLFAAAAALATGGRPQTWQSLLGPVLVRLGACEVMVGNYSHGEQLLQDGLQSVTQDRERAFALARLGFAAAERGDFACAYARLDESLTISRQCEDIVGMARALYYSQIGKPAAEVYALCTECLALTRQSGRPDLIASQLNLMGWHTWCLGDYARANACWQEGLALCEQLDFREEKASALDYLGFAAWGQGDLVTAERQIGVALALYLELGRLGSIGMCKADLALVLVSKGQVEQAIEMARQAVVIARSINGQMILTLSLPYLGAALTAAGEGIEAHGALVEAVQRAWQHQYDHHLMLAFYYFAELLIAESRTADSAGALARRSQAVTLLNCVSTDAATWQVFRDKAAALLVDIQGALPTATFAAAQQEGASITVAQVVSIVLGENSAAPRAEPAAASMLAVDRSPRVSAAGNEALLEPLTAREMAVLRLIAAGRSNQEIAAELVITTGTAKWYVSQVLSKLQVHNRTQAGARGRELGLLA